MIVKCDDEGGHDSRLRWAPRKFEVRASDPESDGGRKLAQHRRTENLKNLPSAQRFLALFHRFDVE